MGCDARGSCASDADYRIEVGTVHASGVSCLLSRPKLQRTSCFPQELGGLRCHSGAVLWQEEPEEPVEGAEEEQDDTIAVTKTTKCLTTPKEGLPGNGECPNPLGEMNVTV